MESIIYVPEILLKKKKKVKYGFDPLTFSKF